MNANEGATAPSLVANYPERAELLC